MISGLHEGRIPYEKVMVKDGAFTVPLIECDPVRRGGCDPIVALISQALASMR
ncbi:MAG TPA: hypothetical protein VHI13_11365 [Candidatus Kapabacteria bacterium]|nr:hypothetical protein [Candidatus Kapabacteria bacterium]